MLQINDGIIAEYYHHTSEAESALPLKVEFDRKLYEDIEFVFLCFTNRCGSNFVAETLGSDGRLNVASEWWNGGEIIRVCREQNLEDFGQYLNGTVRYNARSGRLISKIAVENLVLLYSSGFLSSPYLRSRFLFVERSDRLNQAISFVLATETSSWASHNRPTRLKSDVPFDFSRIRECMASIEDQNAKFASFFSQNSIIPINVNYERFVSDIDRQTCLVGQNLGIQNLRNVADNVSYHKQADEINQAWRERYFATAAATGQSSPA